MKLKKAIASAMATITVLTFGATAFAACEKGCEHQFRWNVTSPATCISTGEERGVCGLCGHVEQREIPISSVHQYGEWTIETPSETATGKAVKVCALSEAHKLEVTLPVITEDGTGYTSSEITTPPSAVTEGERTFVLANENGDISFAVAIPATGIESVFDAIEVMMTKKKLVRRVEGKTYIPGSGGETAFYSNYNYEFGENYTHINFAGDKTEHWCSLDENGEIFVIKKENDKQSQDLTASKDIMEGYGFRIGYAGLGPFYGAENLIYNLYELGISSSAQDFEESFSEINGENVYEFSFGYVKGQYFNELEITFKLTEKGAFKSFEFESDVYGVGSWEFNEETGKAEKKDGENPYGTEELSGVAIMCDSPEGEEVPVNPFPSDWTRVKSFDITFNDSIITEDDVINLTAAPKEGGTSDVFIITNVKNNGEGVSNINYDPVTVYQRVGNRDIPLSYELTPTSLSVLVSGTKITVRSHVLGDITLVVKTQSGSVTKLFNIRVSPCAPSALHASVYEYGDEGYIWNDSATSASIYTGQELLVKAKSPADELTYTDSSFRAELLDEEMNPVSGDFYTLEKVDGAYKFICSQTGTYAIRMVSERNSRIITGVNIEVQNPPAITAILAGSYNCKIIYPEKTDVKVTFTANNLVTVSDGLQGTETLRWTWDEATEKLTTVHVEGAQLGYSISLNEVYKPVLSHPTGIGDGVESVVLQKNVT